MQLTLHPTTHLYCNAAERVMSILNLGLQSVGLARRQMEDSIEEIRKCKKVLDLRQHAKNTPAFRDDVSNSIYPVKILLS